MVLSEFFSAARLGGSRVLHLREAVAGRRLPPLEVSSLVIKVLPL
jgi:hypothetical protein